MVAGPELFADEPGRLGQRGLAEAHGVGAHVGDQTLAVAPAQIDPFVELLRQPHCPPGRHAQLGARRLLQGGGDERGRRAAPGLLLLDAPDPPRTGRRRLPGNTRRGGFIQHHHARGAPQRARPGVEVLRSGDGLATGADQIGGEAGFFAVPCRGHSFGRSAALCTRPALSPARTFFQSTGESE